MNEPRNCTPTKMDEKSDEDAILLKSQIIPKKVCLENESKETDFVDTHKPKIVIPPTSNEMIKTNINDSEYLIYHPPKYTLAPYKDPKLSSLSLRDQVKVICSYHALISRSIANQAKIQIDSCSYPDPIDPIPKKNVCTVQKNDDIANDDLKEGDGSGDKSEEYISRAGRITKRKFYSETEYHKKDSAASSNGNDEEVPTKKKAPPPPPRNRNLRQRPKLDSPEAEIESKKKSSPKTTSAITSLKQQKRSSDGFVEPAVPGSNKRATRKTIQCPICGKFFPEKEIEQHASSCGEISMDDGSTNHQNVNGFRCHSCKRVMLSEEDYEIHCTTCNGGPSYLN